MHYPTNTLHMHFSFYDPNRPQQRIVSSTKKHILRREKTHTQGFAQSRQFLLVRNRSNLFCIMTHNKEERLILVFQPSFMSTTTCSSTAMVITRLSRRIPGP